MDLSLPRGIRDIEPDEYERHQEIARRFEEVASLFNFRMMQPAPLEHLAVLRAKSGTDVDNEIYAFKDKAGRDVGLRFDLTVGMTRYVCARKDLKPPVKLASLGGVWRYDEPQHARYRWFGQWDLEVFGAQSVEADAEVIDASRMFFDRLGIASTSVRVGDRRVVEEFIRRELKAPGEKAVELMRALDKVQKRTLPELEKEYVAKGFSSEAIRRLFEFGSISGSPDKVIDRLSEMKLESAADLVQLRDSLAARGVGGVEYSLGVVRGIDYYTAVVFEVFDGARPDLGALCGGGRYDILPKAFGRPDLPATGAAGGIERIALSLAKSTSSSGELTYVARAGAEVDSYAMNALSQLRAAGIRAEAALQDRSLGKQLEDASAMGARWAVIVGKREAAAKSVTLRDMKSRKEEQLPLSDLPARLKR